LTDIGEHTITVAIVEFEDGHIEKIDPKYVYFKKPAEKS